MAMIKHAAADAVARDAIVLDLGDLRRQGQALIQRARQEAGRIVTEAQRHRERLIADADKVGYERGFERGQAEGYEAGRKEGADRAFEQRREELESLERGWCEALQSFDSTRQRLIREAGVDILRLAALVATKATKRVVELDPTVAESQLAAAIGMVAEPTGLVIRVNPEDRELLEQALPRLLGAARDAEEVSLVSDQAISRGSCIVSRVAEGSAGGEIDARIETQVDRLISSILPDRRNDQTETDPGPLSVRRATEAA